MMWVWWSVGIVLAAIGGWFGWRGMAGDTCRLPPDQHQHGEDE